MRWCRAGDLQHENENEIAKTQCMQWHCVRQMEVKISENNSLSSIHHIVSDVLTQSKVRTLQKKAQMQQSTLCLQGKLEAVGTKVFPISDHKLCC